MSGVDVVAFVLAGIADDEAAARAAIRPETIDGWANPPIPADSGRWKVAAEAGEIDDLDDWYAIEDEESGEIIVYNESRPDADQAVHIARHDPARVLADCAAKKAVVELHSMVIQPVAGWGDDAPTQTRDLPACRQCGSHFEYPVEWPCLTLRLLAQPYAGEPGWDEAWKVET